MSAQSIPPHDESDDQLWPGEETAAADADEIPAFPARNVAEDVAHYDDAALSRYDDAALARYQDLFAHMSVGVVFQDTEGRIVDANPAAQQLLGLTREQLLGLTSFDAGWRTIQVDGVELPGAMHPAMVAMRTGQPVRNAIMGIFIPGKERYRWLRVNAIPRLAPGGERPTGVFMTFDDITEWDYLEEGARILITRYQALMEQAADAVFVADLSGRYIEVNPAACALLGYTREELLSMSIRDIILPEDGPGLIESRDKMLRGETHRAEQQLRRKDGSLVPVEINARIISDGRWQAIVRDITRRRELQEKLRAQTELLERTFEAVHEGVYIYDHTGELIQMNATARAVAGYDEHPEMERESTHDRLARLQLRDPVGKLFSEADWPVYRVLRGEIVSTTAPIEMLVTSATGRELTLQVSGAPLRDADGQLMGAVVVTRDVTLQRRLEQQRMDIFRVVAHDLANPLAAIKLYLQLQQRMIERGHAPSAPDPDVLATMVHEVVRMERLLSDMHAVVGLESNKLVLDQKPFDLVTLCQQEVRPMQMAEMRELHVNLPDEPVMVQADRDRIGQVLANLLSNADKYSPLKQPITLTLRLERGAPYADVSDDDTTAPLRACVLVQDAGPGIPENEQERIWERFHRVRGVQAQTTKNPSLGLGLYISRQIIEQHGGAIGVESAPGAGSTFWFTLPLAPSTGPATTSQ
jgi:PAS domain S-box-containing protein